MNVFVLNTGRCGSVTFARACSHITNFTSGHESRISVAGAERLAFPDRHIEIDNRLAWFCGRLEQQFGDRAFYIHLQRDTDDTIASFVRRADFGIMKAYREGVLLDTEGRLFVEAVAADYVHTVETNIRHFLQGKSHVMTVQLENARTDFRRFWEWIGAEGELQLALQEFDTLHNASVV